MASKNRNPGAGDAGASKNRIPSRNAVETSARPHAAQALLIGEFEVNARETARVTLNRYRGHDLVQIHKWFLAADGQPRPGKGGIAINVRHLPRLAELVAAALEQATAAGLIPPIDGGAR